MANVIGRSVGYNSDGLKVMYFGTSRTSQSLVDDSDEISLTNRGMASWAGPLLGQRFDTVVKGYSGKSISFLRKQIESDLEEVKPDVVCLDIGTNDVAGQTVEYINNIAENIFYICYASVPVVMLGSIEHRDTTTSGWTSAENIKATQINLARKNLVNDNPGSYFVDTNKYLIDPDGSNGDTRANVFNDGTHFEALGAYYVGLAYKEALENIFPSTRDVLWTSPFNVTDGDIELGAVSINPLHTGTSGVNGTGSTGDVSASWRSERITGSNVSVAASKETHSDGITNVQTLTFTTDTANSNVDAFYYRTNTASLTLVPGGVYYAIAEIEQGAWGGFREITLDCFDSRPSGTYYFRSSKNIESGNNPAVNYTAIHKTPEITAEGTSGRIRLRIEVDNSVASDSNAWIKVNRIALVRVS